MSSPAQKNLVIDQPLTLQRVLAVVAADPIKRFPNLPALRKYLVAPSLAAQLTDAAVVAISLDEAKARMEAIVERQLSAARVKEAAEAGEEAHDVARREAAALASERESGPSSGALF